jgi:5-methylcytosine-specific restriction protein A
LLDTLFRKLGANYPQNPEKDDPSFNGSEVGALVRDTLPKAISNRLGNNYKFLSIKGSVGQSTWTHTPWIALLDRSISTSVQEGYYIVYLMSKGCERLYLTINQGCTNVVEDLGIPEAHKVLRKRALVMQGRVNNSRKRLKPLNIDLNVERSVWRGKLYESGTVCGVSYELSNLPSAKEMELDLLEALDMYQQIKLAGGWFDLETMVEELEEDSIQFDADAGAKLKQAIRYKIHRAIERNASHARTVKRFQGTTCKGCDVALTKVYGQIAEGLIEAHHLKPLSTLERNAQVELDPIKDFVVLCPNCHRVIHRQSDVGDLEALRASVVADKYKT